MYDVLKTKKVLLVDDDQWIRTSLSYFFKNKAECFEVIDSAEKAMEVVGEKRFDIVICDYKLPGMNGLEFLKHLTESQPNASTVLISAYGKEGVLAEAEQIGIDEFVEKPFTTKTIEACFERLINSTSEGGGMKKTSFRERRTGE